MTILQIILLAVIQGAAELLPVSSSAHVILAQKLMGLDPGAPQMTFLLVMLHTGTMFAVLVYFWPRWKRLLTPKNGGLMYFSKLIVVATAWTGVLGFGLKLLIEKVILERMLGHSHGEVEHLFRSLPLIGTSLFFVGCLIIFAGTKEGRATKTRIGYRQASLIGFVQGLCLPFRGFSRSGATISAALLSGVSRSLAEDFSFALAVVLTPPVIVLQFRRLVKAAGVEALSTGGLLPLLTPGLLGMIFSFSAGLVALRFLSSALENGRWKYFGFYCLAASVVTFVSFFLGI